MAALNAQQITAVFNDCFTQTHRTVMRGGAAEPLYLPASESRPAEVIYTRDYPASALHEAAHWCGAGVQRRRVADYGYWYEPPPRCSKRQEAFFAVEVKTQALELVFCEAAGIDFRVSVDNPDGEPADVAGFETRVRARAKALSGDSLSGRAGKFARALKLVRGS